ncbi:MAG TPA: formate dehydrogenase accessory sulfurtransferase FdhD [Longimicrobiales bacterium]|nr:formate dehydrogenase accessory sulfurtransferase FdhD [Longimicrobiales bacterium]
MTRDVAAVPERAVRLRVNGLGVALWTCTPGALEALAAGRLLAGGFIRSADDLLALRTLPDEEPVLGVDAEVPAVCMATAVAEGEHRAEHGCGPRFLLDCRPELIRRAPAAPPPDPAVFHGLFRGLYAGSASHRGSGGLHTAALSDGEGLLYLHEEVGRHNAVDKAIGAAVLDGAHRPALGLVTTARISGEIAAKAARAGLAWIASRSVPTSLAVEIAGVAGIPIVARAPGPDARVFAPGEA